MHDELQLNVISSSAGDQRRLQDVGAVPDARALLGKPLHKELETHVISCSSLGASATT